MNRPSRFTSENDLEQRVAAMRDDRARSSEAESVRRTLHDEVAVLHVFDPFAVEAKIGVAAAINILGADIEPANDDEGHPRWSLRLHAREAALGRLGSAKEILERAQRNPARIATRLQLLFESWLEGTTPPLPHDDDASADLRTVASWMMKVRDARPTALSVLNAMQLDRLRARLGAAVGPTFRGRAGELEKLRHPSFGTRTIVIEARGGMGKSALLAKLLLDLGAFEKGSSVLAAYLDLDDPNLDVSEPASLLEAVAVQLDAQVPESLRELIEQTQTARRGSTDPGDGPSRDMFLAMQLRRRFERWMEARERVVIVLDTLERGLSKSPELTRSAIDVLLTALTGIPSTLILAGRGPIPKHLLMEDEDRVSLDELDGDAAVGVLLSLGVPDESFARALADKFGRSPLTLRLVARVVKAGFRPQDLQSAELDASVEHALVLGFLYRRILAQVLDPRVQRIAHPGFALRAITAELIDKVLGWAPDPPVRDEEDARNLHLKLRAVHDLVVVDADGESLRLRPEVRVEVLRLMRNDPAAKKELTRVHEAAVAWFGRPERDASAKAEQVYHLIHLRRFEEADYLWTEEIAQQLVDTCDDFDDEAQAWIDERLEDQALHAHVDRERLREWEEDATKRVATLLARRKIEEALAVLGERATRTGENARLAIMEARTYEMLERLDDARVAARLAEETGERRNDRPMIAEANALLARLATGADRSAGVAQRWQRAIANAKAAGNALLVARILVGAQTDAKSDARVAAMLGNVSDELRQVFLDVSLSELEREPNVVRSIAAHLPDPAVLRRALATGALKYPMALRFDDLASALDVLEDEAKSTRDALASFAVDGGTGWLSILRGAARKDALARVLDYILERHGSDEDTCEMIAALFAESAKLSDEPRRASARDRSEALAALTRIIAHDVAPDDWLALLEQIAPAQVASTKEAIAESEELQRIGMDAAESCVLLFQRTGRLLSAVRELKAITPPLRAAELEDLEKVFAS